MLFLRVLSLGVYGFSAVRPGAPEPRAGRAEPQLRAGGRPGSAGQRLPLGASPIADGTAPALQHFRLVVGVAIAGSCAGRSRRVAAQPRAPRRPLKSGHRLHFSDFQNRLISEYGSREQRDLVKRWMIHHDAPRIWPRSVSTWNFFADTAINGSVEGMWSSAVKDLAPPGERALLKQGQPRSRRVVCSAEIPGFDVGRIKATNLAYLGDAIFEGAIREALIWPPRKINDLSSLVFKVVQ